VSRLRVLLVVGTALLGFAGVLQWILRAAYGERAAHVVVRWAPATDPTLQDLIERVHHLQRVEPTGERTWAYYLADVSTTNIRSLISHPAVEETNSIDRTTAHVAAAAGRGPYITNRPVWVAQLLECLVSGLLVAGGVVLLAGAFKVDLIFGSLLVGAAALRVLLAMNAP
jgi:hypothetical protein